jgi:hypothetical protein
MRRIVIWFLSALALIAAAIVALLVFSPTAHIVMAVLVAPLFSPGPPAIAQAVIAKEDWPHFEVTSKKLTTALQSQFQVGSRESDLKSTLLGQGFRPVDSPPPNCIPPGHQAPVVVISYRCLTPEQEMQRRRTLVYKWSDGICAQSVYVVWSSDDLGILTHIEGSYDAACL